MKIKDIEEEVSVASKYEKGATEREPYLTRAREYSALTVPALMKPLGQSTASKLKNPYQSLGAECLNSIASKLVLAMLPPSLPFFKFDIDEFGLTKLTQANVDQRSAVEDFFSKVERSIMTDINSSSLRNKVTEGMKHLVCTGNVLFYLKDRSLTMYKLNSYVVERDEMGEVECIIIKETFDDDSIPKYVADALPKESENKDEFDVYTYIDKEQGKWVIYQECEGIEIPGSRGSYALDACPYIVLTFYKADGENYGRGLIEEYSADLNNYDKLAKAMVEGGVAASKVVFLVKSGAVVRKDTLARAQNGAFIDGNEGEVLPLQLNKTSDFQFVMTLMSILEKRLGQAFMVESSITRNAERVTAEEIKLMSQMLETRLGGIYSTLAQDFQLPLVKFKLAQLEKSGAIKGLPKDIIKPVITTGVQALGRGAELEKLNTFIQIIAPFGQQALASLNMSDFITRTATALGIDKEGLVKSPEQVAQEAQAQAQQEAMVRASPNIANNAMTQQQSPQ